MFGCEELLNITTNSTYIGNCSIEAFNSVDIIFWAWLILTGITWLILEEVIGRKGGFKGDSFDEFIFGNALLFLFSGAAVGALVLLVVYTIYYFEIIQLLYFIGGVGIIGALVGYKYWMWRRFAKRKRK